MMPISLMITLLAVFASVALLSGAVASLALTRTSPERKRLRTMTAPRVTPAPVTIRIADAPSPTLKAMSGMLPTSARDFTQLRRRLASAGYDDYSAAVWYSIARLAVPIVLGVVPVITFGVNNGWMLGLATGAIGFVLPDLWLSKQTLTHRKAIQDGLPDALDLIVVCIEAGSSLDQAIVKASNELEIALPVLAKHLKTLSTQIRAGKPRVEAFQGLAKRTGVDDVRSLVAMLIHTDRFGTSIAQGLRTHAETLRTKRRQRAEERAGKIGVKLVFPLALCLMPALYVVCVGPVIVGFYRNMF
jgi:tight adherence protein C